MNYKELVDLSNEIYTKTLSEEENWLICPQLTEEQMLSFLFAIGYFDEALHESE